MYGLKMFLALIHCSSVIYSAFGNKMSKIFFFRLENAPAHAGFIPLLSLSLMSVFTCAIGYLAISSLQSVRFLSLISLIRAAVTSSTEAQSLLKTDSLQRMK